MVLLSYGKGGWKKYHELLELENNHMIIFESCCFRLEPSECERFNSYCQREKIGITDIYEKGANVTNLL